MWACDLGMEGLEGYTLTDYHECEMSAVLINDFVPLKKGCEHVMSNF